MPQVPPRYHTTYFSHIWGGGYSAGYYAYLWSEVIDDDAYYWFKEHGGMTRANGQRFRDMILSRGGTEDAGRALPRLPRPRPDRRAAAHRAGAETGARGEVASARNIDFTAASSCPASSTTTSGSRPRPSISHSPRSKNGAFGTFT